MKKVINGRMYNTETAGWIAETGNNLGQNDFHWEEEDLYQKKTGEFFLAGRGGALTKYGKGDGRYLWGSSQIIPLSMDEAKAWVEEHCSADQYIEVFGEPEE